MSSYPLPTACPSQLGNISARGLGRCPGSRGPGARPGPRARGRAAGAGCRRARTGRRAVPSGPAPGRWRRGRRSSRPRARARHAAAHRCSPARGSIRARRSAASGSPATTASSAPAARAYPSHQRSGKAASARSTRGPARCAGAGVDRDPGFRERHDGHQIGIAGRVVAAGRRERAGAPQPVLPVVAQAVHQGGRGEGGRHPGHRGRAVPHPVVPQGLRGRTGLVEPPGQGEHPDEPRHRQVGMGADRVVPAGLLNGGAGGRQVARGHRDGRRHVVGVGDLGRADGLVGGQGRDDPHPLVGDATRLPESAGGHAGDAERVQRGRDQRRVVRLPGDPDGQPRTG